MVCAMSTETTTKQIKKKDKEARISLLWRGQLFPFGKATWQPNGVFVFRSAFYKDLKSPIEWGELRENPVGHLLQVPGSAKKSSHSSLHFTLHPPEGGKDGCLVVHNDAEKVLAKNRRSFEWFPVQSEFHLLSIATPSLQHLVPSNDNSQYKILLPDHYTGSVRCKVDFFPPKAVVLAAPANVVATTPHYRVRLDFLGTGEQSTSAIAIWPIGKDLSL